MIQIKRFREKAGLTQAQLAKKLDVAEITIRSWENDVRTPRLRKLKDIAKVLKCEPAQLL